MIRALGEDDAETFATLRREALRDAPLAFAASPDDDLAASVEAVRDQLRLAPEAVVIGAFRDHLVGMVGLYRDRHRKAAHKVHLWGMYVAPLHRRQAIASALLDAALRHASTLPGVSWVHLIVSDAAPEARRLYERSGFSIWGTEPEALHHGGRIVADHHMALRIERR